MPIFAQIKTRRHIRFFLSLTSKIETQRGHNHSYTKNLTLQKYTMKHSDTI